MAGIYGAQDTTNLPGGASVGPVAAPQAQTPPSSPWTVQQGLRTGRWPTAQAATPAATPPPEGTLPFYGGKPQQMAGGATMPTAGTAAGQAGGGHFYGQPGAQAGATSGAVPTSGAAPSQPGGGHFYGQAGAAPVQGVQGQGLPAGNRAFYGNRQPSQPSATPAPGQVLR